jgi:hypothetical protein
MECLLQSLLNHRYTWWLSKDTERKSVASSVYWKGIEGTRDVCITPRVTLIGDPLFCIAIVVDIELNVYYMKSDSSFASLYEHFRRFRPAWVVVKDGWIICGSTHDVIVVTVWCFTQIRAELGFVERLAKMIRESIR